MRYLLAFAVAVAGAATALLADNGSQQSRAAGEYLVTLAPPAAVTAIAEVYGRFGITGIKRLASDVFLVTVSEDPGPATMEKLRSGNAQIKAVEPNLVYRSQGTK